MPSAGGTNSCRPSLALPVSDGKEAKFELGDPVCFRYEPGKRFVVVRREYRPYSGNWHYLLRGDKWRIEVDLSIHKGGQCGSGRVFVAYGGEG